MGYEYLVVATGTQPDFDSIGGLKHALERADRPVCSTATLDGVAHTRKCISEFSKGAVVFTHPRDPFACTSATHSGMFLADHWLKTKVHVSASSSLCLCACLCAIYLSVRLTPSDCPSLAQHVSLVAPCQLRLSVLVGRSWNNPLSLEWDG